MALTDLAKDLDDEQFAAALLDESRQYMNHHGSFPICGSCRVQVTKPEDLVRYFGINLHDSCFIEVYEKERNGHHLKDTEREYFDRVLKAVKARNRKEFDFTI